VTDNITLRRAVVKWMRDELYSLVRETDSDCEYLNCKECEPIRPIWDVIVVFDAALAEPEPDAIARAVEAEREPATDEQIVKAGGECAVVDNEYLLDFRDGFRAAERFHGIRKEDK
jgi:hypothetical protein